MRKLPALTTNQALAAAAFLLGLGALFISPSRGGAVSIHPGELARIVQTEVDHVTPDDLADWIVQGRADFRLIDVRDEKAYSEYHIPGAELLPITKLADASLARNEKIVLYSDGGIHSAQAWFLLRARGYQGVYILRGGLDEWRDQVLSPVLATEPTPFEARRNERLQARAAHFGGQARVGTGTAPEPVPVAAAPVPVAAPPPAAAPAAPAAPAGAAAPAKKKKEGC
jgi:hypothetical protein